MSEASRQAGSGWIQRGVKRHGGERLGWVGGREGSETGKGRCRLIGRAAPGGIDVREGCMDYGGVKEEV